MPIYEYRCSRCGHEFEAWQKMSDPPVKVCPKCHAHKVEKLISATSFQLKGTGWYATDYGRGKSARPPHSSHSGEGSSDGGASGASGSAASGEKPSGEKPSGEKPSGEKSGGERSGGERSGGEKSGSSARGSGSHRLAAAAA
jgi:putative FmdB family regulatory protein